ncbi:hypothetical protein WDZ16_08200 [Pseudokineococcus marinus]|uniref:Uncharacterized protein n=1 Tax=Pseudokineococcus marinus TaxID=351215 RepID=A0A849BJ94_9ACTN|nr:hypothetical protein [Pseudokineococcus marinus]NNH22691.1 hypothetical protein [Pseudokineococcus marinus]
MISLHQAEVGCQVSMVAATLDGLGGEALRADHMSIAGSLLMRELKSTGRLYLHGVYVLCHWDMTDARVSSNSSRQWTLVGDRGKIDGDLTLDGAQFSAGVNFTRVSVVGDIRLVRTNVQAAFNGTALQFASSAVGGNFDASEVLLQGTLDTSLSAVGHSFVLADANISRDGERSLLSPRISVHGDVVLERLSARGTVDLLGAEIRGSLRAADSKLTATPLQRASLGSVMDRANGGHWRGSSIRMSNATVAGDFDARSSHLLGLLEAADARVAGDLIFELATLGGDAPAGLDARNLEARHLDLRFESEVVGDVILAGARLHRLTDASKSWPAAGKVDVQNMHYELLSGELDAGGRLRWLERVSSPYAPQPYRQLARTLRQSGQFEQARGVDRARLRARHKQGPLHVRAWGWLQDLTVGYGFLPSRALMTLAVLYALGVTYFTFATDGCAALRTDSGLCPTVENASPTWNPFVYTLGALVPFLGLSVYNTWQPEGADSVVTALLIVGGLILTTTIVAAVSRGLMPDRDDR